MEDRPAVLRVKRRRDEEPLEHVLLLGALQSAPKKSPAPLVGELERSLGSLWTATGTGGAPTSRAPRPARFRRVASVREAEAWSKDVLEKIRSAQRRESVVFAGQAAATTGAAYSATDALKAKATARHARHAKDAREKARARSGASASGGDGDSHALLTAFRVFDVVSQPESAAHLIRKRQFLRPRDWADRPPFVPAVKLAPGRILNPFERQMDEAIWRAFAAGDLAPVFAAARGGADINYQRIHSDLTTGLMAAAFHGDARAASQLIRQGALARIADASGRSAARIAAERGHAQLAGFLRDVQHEEEEEFAAAVAAGGCDRAHRQSGPDPDAAAISEFDFDVFVAEDDDGGGWDEGRREGGCVPAVPTSGEGPSAAVFPAAAAACAPEAAAAAATSLPASSSTPFLRRIVLDDVSLAVLWAQPGDSDALSDDGEAWYAGGGSSEEDEDSEDSCREGAPGNDYPEEGCGDGSSSSGSEDGGGDGGGEAADRGLRWDHSCGGEEDGDEG